MERVSVKPTKKKDNIYFEDEDIKSFPTGCTVLNLALGGGWAKKRIINLVGDESTGKTLLAIEAAANFRRQHTKSEIYYAEAESAFDKDYAETMGLPVDNIFFPEVSTIEDLFESLQTVCQKKTKTPKLYIVDSLDALTDRDELARTIDEGTYGANKPKKLSQIFRRLVRMIAQANMTVIIISQTRDAIGVTFGDKKRRAGGKALDFYASQVVWLAKIGKVESTKNGVKRPVGVTIRARCKKNKLGPPFRECDFPIRFNYGVDDESANLIFLEETKRLSLIGVSKDGVSKYLRKLRRMPDSEYNDAVKQLRAITKQTWKEVEESFKPERKKYE